MIPAGRRPTRQEPPPDHQLDGSRWIGFISRRHRSTIGGLPFNALPVLLLAARRFVQLAPQAVG